MLEALGRLLEDADRGAKLVMCEPHRGHGGLNPKFPRGHGLTFAQRHVDGVIATFNSFGEGIHHGLVPAGDAIDVLHDHRVEDLLAAEEAPQQ